MNPIIPGAAILGLTSALGSVLADPDKAAKWGSYFFRAISWFSSSANATYLRLDTESTINGFLANRIYPNLSDNNEFRVRIQWVDKATDAALNGDGTVVVPVVRQRDAARNYLLVAKCALPHTLCPVTRQFVEPMFFHAVDLLLMKKLADAIGGTALTLYTTDYLAPRIQGNEELKDLHSDLAKIRDGGLFESALLQELVSLSHPLSAEPPSLPITRSVLELKNRILWLATREPHDESKALVLMNKWCQVAFLLLSKTATAIQGTDPYIRRFNLNLTAGARSIYVIGLTRDQRHLCDEIVGILSHDKRVRLRKHYLIKTNQKGSEVRLPLALFQSNLTRSREGTFTEQLAEVDIHPGSVLRGTVQRAETYATVYIDGLRGIVQASNLAWGYYGSVKPMLSTGTTREFRVLKIDDSRHELVLGVKQLSPSPWENQIVPEIGKVVNALVLEKLNDDSVSVKLLEYDSLYARIHFRQLEGTRPLNIGEKLIAQVIDLDPDQDLIELSHRSWDHVNRKRIEAQYPINSPATATVVSLEEKGIVCELEAGVRGFISGEELAQSGFELARWRTTVIPGQKFDVIIGRLSGNGRISLRLARNRKK